MSISRRNFIKALAGATAAAAGIGVPAVLYLTQDDDQPESTPSPSQSPTTEASVDLDNAIQILLATTNALFIAYTVEPNHYEAYFRYNTTNAEGYPALYNHYVSTVDVAAQALGHDSFIDADHETQRSILDNGLQHIIDNDFQDASANILSDTPTWEHYARFILREMLSLFMYTDAWIALGYDGWPGMARGLEQYHEPLVTTGNQIVG